VADDQKHTKSQKAGWRWIFLDGPWLASALTLDVCLVVCVGDWFYDYNSDISHNVKNTKYYCYEAKCNSLGPGCGSFFCGLDCKACVWMVNHAPEIALNALTNGNGTRLQSAIPYAIETQS
jgi:hypothetical protein